jgi:hypothetical protein
MEMTKDMIRYLFGFVLALWASALSAQAHWSFDYHQYQYDMTVYFELMESGSVVDNFDRYEVAAFVGEECRGIGKFETQTGSNGTTLSYGFLKVYSNAESGETVTFRIYDKSAQEEFAVKDVSVPFVSSSAVGYPSDPLILAFEQSFKLGDVNGDGEITAQDASLVLQLVAKKIAPTADGIVYGAADVNDDGDVTAQDASLILQYVAKKISW